ncbi:hypothetical protein Tco_1420273 [Tanacetum coccineum]
MGMGRQFPPKEGLPSDLKEYKSEKLAIDITRKWLGVRINMSRYESIRWMKTTSYERLSMMRDVRTIRGKIPPMSSAKSEGRFISRLPFSLALSSEGPPPLTFLSILPLPCLGLLEPYHPFSLPTNPRRPHAERWSGYSVLLKSRFHLPFFVILLIEVSQFSTEVLVVYLPLPFL